MDIGDDGSALVRTGLTTVGGFALAGIAALGWGGINAASWPTSAYIVGA